MRAGACAAPSATPWPFQLGMERMYDDLTVSTCWPERLQKIDCQPNDGFVVKDAKTGGRVNSSTAQPVGRNGCYMKRAYMQYCLKVRASQWSAGLAGIKVQASGPVKCSAVPQ